MDADYSLADDPVENARGELTWHIEQTRDRANAFLDRLETADAQELTAMVQEIHDWLYKSWTSFAESGWQASELRQLAQIHREES